MPTLPLSSDGQGELIPLISFTTASEACEQLVRRLRRLEATVDPVETRRNFPILLGEIAIVDRVITTLERDVEWSRMYLGRPAPAPFHPSRGRAVFPAGAVAPLDPTARSSSAKRSWRSPVAPTQRRSKAAVTANS